LEQKLEHGTEAIQMAATYREVGTDHKGIELADGISGMVRNDNGMFTGYRIRWREEDGDGIERQPSKSFSGKKHGTARSTRR
jgi:hypothetical protein